MTKFFFVPFAQGGDLGTTPDFTQPNGSVSYTVGYGPDYQLPLPSGGAAIAINRAQFNGLMNDITGALNTIQTQGINSWIGPSPYSPPDYSGNYPYPINALVYYTDGNIYQSLIAANQDTPGATGNWVNISLNAGGGVPIGSSIDFMGLVAPTNYLIEDGTAYSRTTYAKLLAAITLTLTGTTTGTSAVVTMASTAGIVPGLQVESTNIPANTTVLSVIANTSITLSQAASSSGSTSLQFFAWGNGDGSTTFNVPNAQRRTMIGAGGTVTDTRIGNAVGNTCSVELPTIAANQLVPHTHQVQTISYAPSAGPATVQALANSIASVAPVGVTWTTAAQTPTGGTVPFSITQPSMTVLKCIRYQ